MAEEKPAEAPKPEPKPAEPSKPGIRDQAMTAAELAQPELAPIYYFELNQTQIDEIESNELEASLYMRFADDETDKEADIFVNNHAIRLDQTEIDFEEVIDNYVEEGNNAIKIEPDDILDIVELKVVLEET